MDGQNPPLTPSTLSILSETSTDIKKQRETQTVPYSQIEGTLKYLTGKTELSEIEIFRIIGLSPSSFYDAKRLGKCRLITKFALEGYLAQLETINPTHPQIFSFSQLTTIFYALVSCPPTPSTQSLLKPIAQMLTETNPEET